MATKPVPTGPMATQPVITITAITSLASAVIAGIAMLVDLPPDTEKVVLGILTAAYPIVTAAWTWHKVYSPASAQVIANDAAVTGTPAKTDPPPATKQGDEIPVRSWVDLEIERSLNVPPEQHGVNRARRIPTV